MENRGRVINAGAPFTYHELPWADIEKMASVGGSVSAAEALRRSERSRVLLLVRAILDLASDQPDATGPLPSLQEAWDVLAHVQRSNPNVLDTILDHPFTGSWASHTIRRLRGYAVSQYPLWVELGNLHALTASAAIRAKLDVRLHVPVLAGAAVLPTLGSACVDTGASSWSVGDVRVIGRNAEISCGQGLVRVPEDPTVDTAEWWGVRRLALQSGARELSLHLDSVDPYRGIRQPIAPSRLGSDEFDAWAELLQAAWGLVCQSIPDIAEALPTGLTTVVPLPPVGRFREVNASTADAFGSAVIGRPREPATLAAIMVHEFQHIQLGALLHLVRLHDDDEAQRFYAPWRDDPRPLSGILQGIYAFAGAAAFWRGLCQHAKGPLGRRAAFEFARWRAASLNTLYAVQDEPALTDAGRRFLAGVATRLRPWQDEEIPPEIAEAAAAAAADHFAGWRVRHLHPSRQTVTALARAWLAGWPASKLDFADGLLESNTDDSWPRDRVDMLRTRSMSGSLLDGQTENDDASAADWTQEFGKADQAFAACRYEEALRGYLAELAIDPHRSYSWVGLALSTHAARPGPVAETLLLRPELVRAVWHAICETASVPPEPFAVATWLAEGFARSC